MVDGAQEPEAPAQALRPLADIDPLPCPAPTPATVHTVLEQKHATNRHQSLRKGQGTLTPLWEKLGDPLVRHEHLWSVLHTGQRRL